MSNFGLSAGEIIYNNFWIATIDIFVCLSFVFLSYRIHPLKLIKIRSTCFFILCLFLPYLVLHAKSQYGIFIIQLLLLMCSLNSWPANAIFIKHIPVLKRMMATSFLYAISRAVMHVITSFGLVYLTEWLGYYGIWVVVMPVTIGYMWATKHFEKLERIASLEKPSVHEATGTYEELLLNPDKKIA